MKKILYLSPNWTDNENKFNEFADTQAMVKAIAETYPIEVQMYTVDEFALAFNDSFISDLGNIAIIEEPDRKLTEIERLNFIYDKYRNKFGSNFHNALWQILINNCFDSKIICFVVGNMENEDFTLGIVKANEVGGYHKVNVSFKNQMYDTACDICEDMNVIAFDLSIKIQNYLQLFSMRTKLDNYPEKN